MKLMIVDQQAGTREMIRQFLNLPGIAFCECASGDEALARAREFKPDWITVDVNLLGVEGFQTAANLRAEHPSARVIIVTGYDEPHFLKLYNSVGRSALFEKKTSSSDTAFRRRPQKPATKARSKRPLHSSTAPLNRLFDRTEDAPESTFHLC
jgi:two-component system response regulator DesR